MLALLAGPSLLVVFLSVVEEAGGVELAGVTNSFCKQLNHLTHKTYSACYSRANTTKNKELDPNVQWWCSTDKKCCTSTCTDLVIGEKGNAMIHSHSANGEIVLQVASVVVGQVDHQVYVTLSDQSRNTEEFEEMLFVVKAFQQVVEILKQHICSNESGITMFQHLMRHTRYKMFGKS